MAIDWFDPYGPWPSPRRVGAGDWVVLRKWFKEYAPPRLRALALDVPVGGLSVDGMRSFPELRAALGVAQLRADAVADFGDERWAIEAKTEAYGQGLGQALLYREAAEERFPALRPWRAVLIAGWVHPLVVRLAERLGVVVIDVHLSELPFREEWEEL